MTSGFVVAKFIPDQHLHGRFLKSLIFRMLELEIPSESPKPPHSTYKETEANEVKLFAQDNLVNRQAKT